MAGKGMTYGGGDALKQTQNCSLDYVFASSPSNSFLGSSGMFSFGAVGRVKRSGSLCFGSFEQDESGDEYFDEYFNQPEKKRRLSVDQIQFLEKSFEADNKLEPDRKVQLAKELGLPPRQIAIWFQNRRARWKNKQLETDYEMLHASYENLKNCYDNLLKENQKLKEEVHHLKQNGLARDIEKANSEMEATSKQVIADTVSEVEEQKVAGRAFQNEEQSLTKSDVTDASSPRCTDRNYNSLIQSCDISHVFEHDQSDLLQSGEDNLNVELLQPACFFPTVEDSYRHPPANSNTYGFQVEDHAYGFWSY